MVNVVLMVSQGLSCALTKAMHASPALELVGVVTQHPLRDRIYGYPSAVQTCRQLGVPVFQPKSLSPAFVTRLATLQPDLLVTAYYPRVLPRRLLEIPRLGVINVHPGHLPEYRGTFPTAWYILNGAEEFGITVHLLDGGVDTGPILLQRMYPMQPGETGFAFYQRSMELAGELLLEALAPFLRGELHPRPQVGSGSYYGSLPKRMQLDWQQSAAMIERHVRVHARPYFPVFNFLVNRMVLIDRVRLVGLAGTPLQRPGHIVQVEEDGSFVVAAADAFVAVIEHEVVPGWTDLREQRLHIQVGARLE